MKYYAAPMEGITGCLFRRLHRQFFPGADRYYTPFLTANQTKHFKNKELRDIDPAENAGVPLVPQVLTKDPVQFAWAVDKIRDLGYEEVNLNLGCPSPTVTSHGRGSALLKDLDGLDRFFDASFRLLSGSGARISVKTRIPERNEEAAEELMRIFDRYPFSEIIVHPREQKDFYQNVPDLSSFSAMFRASEHPVCYNGDICSRSDYGKITAKEPGHPAVMLGRGLLANPALIEELQTGERKMTAERCREWNRALALAYRDRYREDRNTLFRMKELWYYFGKAYPGEERLIRKVKRAGTLAEYLDASDAVFASGEPGEIAGALTVMQKEA